MCTGRCGEADEEEVWRGMGHGDAMRGDEGGSANRLGRH
jgi:hypothetical protein